MRFMMRWIVVVVTAGLLLVTSTGCDPCSFAAGVGAGWLAATRGLLDTAETVCYRNGVPVDCGQVPANLLDQQ